MDFRGKNRVKVLVAAVEKSDLPPEDKAAAIVGVRRIAKKSEANWAGNMIREKADFQAAFLWGYTKEGFDFWQEVDTATRGYLT